MDEYSLDKKSINIKDPFIIKDSPILNWYSKAHPNASVILGGNRILNLDTLNAGDLGSITIYQDSIGNRTLQVSENSKVLGVYSPLLPLSTAPNSVDYFQYYYDGTFIFWTPSSSASGGATTVQLNAEIASRIAADLVIQSNVDSESSTRGSADTTLQNNINSEASTRASADTSLGNRTTILENNEFKILYYASINSSTGTITKPTNSTIILNDFPQGIDAVCETIVNGEPSGLSATTSGGVAITVSSFDIAGNYVFSGIPSAYPVALVYVLKIKAIDYANLTLDNIIESQNIDGATVSYVDTNLSLKEDLTNKSTSVVTDQASNTKYSSVKSIYDWATSAFTTTGAVASQITTALTGYATQAYVTSQGYITNVVTALGYTPENVANKSSSYTASSTTTYANTKALVDGLATKQNTLTELSKTSTFNTTFTRQTSKKISVSDVNIQTGSKVLIQVTMPTNKFLDELEFYLINTGYGEIINGVSFSIFVSLDRMATNQTFKIDYQIIN